MMEREIRIRFIGDAKDMRRASQEAKESLKAVEQGATEAAKATAASADKASGSIRNYAAEIGKLAGLLAGATAAAGLFWKGIAQNAEVESLKLGIATIVSANETITDATGKQIEGAAKLAVAQGQVASVFEQMKIDAINTTATLPQLAQGFQAALAPAMAMGMSLDDTRKITVGMVQAMGAMSIPMDQMRSEVNAILQANITNDSTLAKNLGITNQMVKSWQQQGTLVDNLNAKLKDFTVAGKLAGETWNGVTSTLQDKIGVTLGSLTEGSFESLTKTIGDLNGLFGDDAQQKARAWGSVIKDGMEVAIDAAGLLGGILGRIADNFLHTLQHARMLMSQNEIYKERGAKIMTALDDLPIFRPGDRLNDPRMDKVREFAKTGNIQSSRNFAGSLGLGLESMGTIESTMIDRLKAMAPDLTTPQIMQQARSMGFGKGQLDKLRKALADAEGFAAQAITERADEISGMVRDAKSHLNKGTKITPNKPAPGATKPGKASKASTLGGVYGPSLPTPADQNAVTGGLEFGPATDDAAKIYEEIAKNKALIGTKQDPLVQGMTAYREWKAEEGKRLRDDIAYASSMVGGLLEDSIRNGRGPSGGDFARAGSSIASMFGPLGAPAAIALGVVGAGLDRNDRDKDVLTGASLGEQVDRKEYEAALRRKYTKTRRMGIRGSNSTSTFDQEGYNAELGAFDTRSFGRLMSQFEKGPEGDKHRAELGLEDQLAKMVKDGMPTEQIEAFKTARTAEIEATYKLTKAQQEAAAAMAEVTKSIGIFGGVRGVAGLRESLGLGKGSANDVERALWMSDSGASVGEISSAASQNTILSSLEDLLFVQSQGKGDYVMGQGGPMITSLTGGANSAIKGLQGVGLDVAGKSVDQLVTLLQGIIVPAMQDLKSITGGAATGSISGAGTDNALAFDAPQTRMITNNNAITVNTMAITGDKASVRELARILATEMNTLAGQSV